MHNLYFNAFIHLIEGQKGLDFEKIKLVSECYNHLINQNNILENFDATLLEKMLQKAIGRIIRKANKQSNSQIKFYKETFTQAYSKLAFSDKVLIQIKAIFG